MQRLAHLIQLPPHQANALSVAFRGLGLDALQFEQGGGQALSRLIVQLMGKAQAFALLRLNETPAQGIAFRFRRLARRDVLRDAAHMPHFAGFGTVASALDADPARLTNVRAENPEVKLEAALGGETTA